MLLFNSSNTLLDSLPIRILKFFFNEFPVLKFSLAEIRTFINSASLLFCEIKLIGIDSGISIERYLLLSNKRSSSSNSTKISDNPEEVIAVSKINSLDVPGSISKLCWAVRFPFINNDATLLVIRLFE